MRFVAGTVSGVCLTLVGHPLDTVKVLMQVPMSEARAVGALSDRQRARLLELVKPT